LLGAAGIAASHAELRNAHRIALHLELVSRRIVLRILAHATWIAETGCLIVVVIARIWVRIMVDNTAAPLWLIRLGMDVVRYPRVGRLGPLTGCLVRGRRGVLIHRLLAVGRMQAPAESAQPQKKGQGDSHASEM